MPRGNPNKLIPMNKRTKQEQSQIASAGGKASGVARARAKAFREKIDDIFSDDDFGTLLLELKKDYKNANPSQKVQILSWLRDTRGEKPTDKIELQGDFKIDGNIESEIESKIFGKK